MAKTTVKETIDEVNKRNKLIRLADKSDAGLLVNVGILIWIF